MKEANHKPDNIGICDWLYVKIYSWAERRWLIFLKGVGAYEQVFVDFKIL